MSNRPALTASDVQKMVVACKGEATKNKWNVSIAVVDDAGYLLYLERLDGAGPVTAEVATEKATTAARTRRPTKFWDGPRSSSSRAACRFRAACPSCIRTSASARSACPGFSLTRTSNLPTRGSPRSLRDRRALRNRCAR